MDKTEIYAGRLNAIRKYLQEKNLNGALFTSYENRRYFSGFTGSNGYLIVNFDKAVLITDKRYTTQAQQQCVGVEVVEYLKDRAGMACRFIKDMGIDRIVDMARTAVNVTGDAVCTTIVAKQAGMIDKDVFNEKM